MCGFVGVGADELHEGARLLARAAAQLLLLAHGGGRVDAVHRIALGHVDPLGEHRRRHEHAQVLAEEP